MKKLSYLLTALFAVLTIFSCTSEVEDIQEQGKLLVQIDIVVDGIMTKASTEAGYTTGAGTYHRNENCTVGAHANEGYELVSFVCNEKPELVGASTYTTPVDKNLRFVANFQKKKSNPIPDFIAVGKQGYIYTMKNQTLTSQQVGNQDWNWIISSGDNYIVFGNGGSITKSSDGGTSWDTPTSISEYDIARAVKVGNLLVAATVKPEGQQNTFMMYSESSSWIKSENYGWRMTLLAYGNGKYVTIGEKSYVEESNDGKTWSTNYKGFDANSYPMYDLCFGDGKFITVGTKNRIYYSTNATNWTKVNESSFTSDILNSVTYGHGKYVTVGYDYIYYSADAINWTKATYDEPLSSYQKVKATSNGFIALTANNCMSFSPDGINWQTPQVIKDSSDQVIPMNAINEICITQQ